jgi:hypothetical protein
MVADCSAAGAENQDRKNIVLLPAARFIYTYFFLYTTYVVLVVPQSGMGTAAAAHPFCNIYCYICIAKRPTKI